MANYRSKVLSFGLGTPGRVVTNNDLAKFVDTSDEWISSRTGIRERKFLNREGGETLHSISLEASLQAIQKSGLANSDIDLVIVCTATPDTSMPQAAARIAGALGHHAGSFDVNAACSGFLSGLHLADSLVRTGAQKNVLVVGADAFSSILDFNDRAVCVLFGDGAGATVVTRATGDTPNDSMIVASKLATQFDEKLDLAVLGGGSACPVTNPRFMKEAKPFLTMNGKEVFKNATRAMAQISKEVLASAGFSLKDVTHFVPHQANMRIIEMVGKLLDFPLEKTFVNLDRWGNTSAATVAICLAEMQAKHMLKKGDLILTSTFGAGYTYGAMLIRI